MVGNTPGILPKTALVGSKAIYYPFTIPTKLNESATLVGTVNHTLVKNLNSTLQTAYTDLQPRGPAKWLLGLFDKVGESVAKSETIAARNKAVFWDPFSQGTEGIGRAFAGPGAYWYAKKVGVAEPTADTIKAALNTKLFKFPTAEELGGAAAPAAADAGVEAGPPPVQVTPAQLAEIEAAMQAAQGAGQVAAA